MNFTALTGARKPLRHASNYKIHWNKDSISLFQTDVKLFLCPFWQNDEVYEEFPLVGTKLTFDFYNASKKIAVEVQGQQHTKFVKFFHGNRVKFLEQLKRDKMKEDYAELNGITLVTIFPEDEICKELFAEFGIELV
jgi:hypothetical protein